MEYRRSHGSNFARYHQFFLFEATGDSEDDSTIPVEYCSEANLQNFIWMNILGGFPFITNNTGCEDDAESCSSDSIDETRDFLLDSNDTTTVEAETVAEEEEEEEIMEVEEEVAMAGKVRKESSNSNGIISRKMMIMEDENHEMEADRVFWETCLEAGYP